jgi:hypothetical protein
MRIPNRGRTSATRRRPGCPVTLQIAAKLAVIVENEITLLSVRVPAKGLVLRGKGFEVDRAGSMPWLADANIAWGLPRIS